MPSPTNPRGDDIAVGACFCQRRNDMLSAACLNLKNTSNQPPMSFLRGQVGERESMGGGSKKVKTMVDGIRKHRFHALTQSSAGMTCFLLPVSTSLRWDDIAVGACFCPSLE